MSTKKHRESSYQDRFTNDFPGEPRRGTRYDDDYDYPGNDMNELDEKYGDFVEEYDEEDFVEDDKDYA